MELNIKADLTQTLGVREMHQLIEINIRSEKKFECIFLNKEQAQQVIEKLQSFVDPNNENVEILPLYGFKTEWQKVKRGLDCRSLFLFF